ncbi:Variant surface glycoprotein, partial [Trypanosoma congolense IL3000]
MWEQRRMGNGIMAMVVSAIFMCINGVRGGDVSDYKPGHNFNGAEHDVLCEVLKASADLWDASRKTDLKLDNGLEKSLGQALFGKESGGNLEDIKDTLPPEYNTAAHRELMCGWCHHKQPAHPGKSIPHDLMCLCTPGKYAEPFYSYWFFKLIFEETGFKLCGKQQQEMVKDKNDGWYVDGQDKKVVGLQKPWNTVIMGCLKGSVNKTSISKDAEHKILQQKLKRLNTALQEFVNKMVQDNKGRPKFGGKHRDNTESDGKDEKSMHVRYRFCGGKKYGGGRSKTPWWQRLQNSLRMNEEQLIVSRQVTTQASGGSDETEDSEVDETLDAEGEDFPPEEDSNTHTVRTQDSNGSSTHIPTTNSSTNITMGPLNTTEARNSTFPRIEYLRSNTPKNLPC